MTMQRLALCIGSSLTASLLLFGSSSKAAGYDEDIKNNFMAGCMQAALSNKASHDYSSKYCNCAWEGTTNTIPWEVFEKFDRGEINIKEAGLNQIAITCGGNPNKLPEKVRQR